MESKDDSITVIALVTIEYYLWFTINDRDNNI